MQHWWKLVFSPSKLVYVTGYDDVGNQFYFQSGNVQFRWKKTHAHTLKTQKSSTGWAFNLRVTIWNGTKMESPDVKKFHFNYYYYNFPNFGFSEFILQKEPQQLSTKWIIPFWHSFWFLSNEWNAQQFYNYHIAFCVRLVN